MMDNVECKNCGWIGLIPLGSEECPSCHTGKKEGTSTLSWRFTPDGKEQPNEVEGYGNQTEPQPLYFKFEPAIPAYDGGTVRSVEIVVLSREDDEVGENMFDLFDDTGSCLNEGCLIFDLLTRQQVEEFVRTHKIKGLIE